MKTIVLFIKLIIAKLIPLIVSEVKYAWRTSVSFHNESKLSSGAYLYIRDMVEYNQKHGHPRL